MQPQQRSQRPQPCPNYRRNRPEDPMASAVLYTGPLIPGIPGRFLPGLPGIRQTPGRFLPGLEGVW